MQVSFGLSFINHPIQFGGFNKLQYLLIHGKVL
jgi:hypothetical protein